MEIFWAAAVIPPKRMTANPARLSLRNVDLRQGDGLQIDRTNRRAGIVNWAGPRMASHDEHVRRIQCRDVLHVFEAADLIVGHAGNVGALRFADRWIGLD